MAAGTAELKLPRLSAATVDALAPGVARPRYDRAVAGTGIVHLGVGAFMRAHIAVYCDEILSRDGGDWAIAGVSLRRPNVAQMLEPQDCLYLVGVAGAERRDYRLVASLQSVSVAGADPQAIIELLARPATRIVSITVTEKGYCVDARHGGLDAGHADVVYDLDHPGAPCSLVGLLYAACVRRREQGIGPVTVLSCDNLPANGRLLRRAVLDFAALVGDDEAESWIRDRVCFPSTMVDRIVPATTDDDVEAAARETGVIDRGLVCTEPFTQWVVEDDFAAGRPAWEAAGALLVRDVAPYETAKLRLLNGAHSSIAYLGYLAGFRYVHEVMADATMTGFIERMMREEISPVTPAPAGMEHGRYVPDLLERFRNPALRHRTWQIAMDGSQKLPQRLLTTIRLQLERDGPIDAMALAVAAWIRYALGEDDGGDPIEVSDPLAATFASIRAECGRSPGAVVDRFLALKAVFGDALPADRRFRQALLAHLESLSAHGSRETVRRLATRARP